MRSKKTVINTAVALVLQFVTAVCGLILPRLIIKTFGSDINGLTTSITQFLGYVSLLEAGVGAVSRAALYSPLANNDIGKVSTVVKATEQFFRKIALVFLAYCLILAVIYPYLVDASFDWFFASSLVLIIAASTFVQYYFGITYSILLGADQRSYIVNAIQIVALILNTSFAVLLIYFGASIHIVKLASAAIFILRPIGMNIYVKKKYRLDTSCEPDKQAIAQRWDGLGQHVAYFLHNHTDVVLLTLFSTLINVSIYSVYNMITTSLKSLVDTLATGIEAAFGNIIAKNEQSTLHKTFRQYELISSSAVTILFSTAGMLILSFIALYTRKITDANYIQPLFGYILLCSEAVFCIRLPYRAVTYAAGHIRQTRNASFVEAAINIVLSIFLVQSWGLVGVAIGTLAAMLFHTNYHAWYASKNILHRSLWEFIKRQIITVINVVLILTVCHFIVPQKMQSFSVWVLWGVITVTIASGITAVFIAMFYRDDAKQLLARLGRLIRKK